MKYLINHISCDISEDSWDNGLSSQLFHSYSYALNEIVDREGLLKKLSGHTGRELNADDIEIDDNYIHINTLVKFRPNEDWNEFPVATKEEIELWKQGEMTLYCAEYRFRCYLISSFDVLV